MIGGACFCAAVVAFFIKVYLRVVIIFFFFNKNLGFRRRISFIYLNIIHFIFDGRGCGGVVYSLKLQGVSANWETAQSFLDYTAY